MYEHDCKQESENDCSQVHLTRSIPQETLKLPNAGVLITVMLSWPSTLMSSPNSSVNFDRLCFEPVSCTSSKALLTKFRID